MAIQTISVGTAANDGTGDPLRTAMQKVNANFSEIGSPSAFLAYRTSDDANATGNGATSAINFPTEVFDVASEFSSGTFTAAQSGKYRLTAAVQIADLTTAMTGHQINIITSNRTYSKVMYFNPISGGAITLDLNVLADMDAADTATVSVTISGGAGNTADVKGHATNMLTFFSGHMVSH